jgi:hypothetical protein
MKAIANFLHFMSKTDKDIIQNCSNATRSTRAALGLFVTITAVFAFISGTYAISTIFRQVNENTGELYLPIGKLLISIFVGVIYAVLIANIDREIVSSPSKNAALVRFPLAIILGIVLAYPLELKLMEHRITKHLIAMSDSENKSAQLQMNQRLSELSIQETAVLKNIQREKDEVAKWSKLMHAETGGIYILGSSGVAGQGNIFNEAKRNMELHQANQIAEEKELEIFRDSYPEKNQQINKEYELSYRSQSFDFLSQMEALSDLKQKSKAVNLTAWGILLVLIILELTPALLKLITVFEKKSEYDLLMEGRLGINNTSISVYANNAINEIENDVSKANGDYVFNLKNLVKS